MMNVSNLKKRILNSNWMLIIAFLSRIRLHKSISKNNSFICSKSVYFKNCKIIVRGSNNKIIIGNNCRLKNMIIEVKGNNNLIKLEGENFIYEKCYISIIGQKCSVDIATKTTIGSAHFFLEESNTSIIVGENCMLGRDIILSTTDFHSILDLETKKRINPPASVIIGNKVWIGTNVKIAKGASITDNSVVAQSSIVNKKFKQPNIIIGGIPAKIIKEQIYWSREKL